MLSEMHKIWSKTQKIHFINFEPNLNTALIKNEYDKKKQITPFKFNRNSYKEIRQKSENMSQLKYLSPFLNFTYICPIDNL